MRTPRALQPPQDRDGAREVADQDAFGDFKLETRRRQAGFQQDLMDEARQVAVLELHRRQIDGDMQRPRPRCGLAACRAQDPFAERDDQPAFLGERDEGAGRHKPVARMMPAHQRLEAGDLAIDVGLRLIVKFELVARDRGAQVLLQRALLAQLLVHRHFEEPDRAAHLGFGAEQRGIGICHQRRRIGAVLRKMAMPMVSPDPQRVAVDLDVGVERARKPFGERFRRPPAARRSA